MSYTFIQHVWWMINQIYLRTESNSCNSLNNFDQTCMFIVDTMAAYVWNFSDLFIILVSTGLTERYRFLNKSVIKSKMWSDHKSYWHELRLNYSLLSRLVKETDKIISPLIFISFYHNFFWICHTLFLRISSLNNDGISEATVLNSFGFVALRMTTVMCSASGITAQTKVILPVISRCPASKFTNEARRLEHQLKNDDILLTGMGFFFITRKFIFAVISTIVIYEMILLKLKANPN